HFRLVQRARFGNQFALSTSPVFLAPRQSSLSFWKKPVHPSFFPLVNAAISSHSWDVSSLRWLNSPAPPIHSPPSMVTTSPLRYPAASEIREAARFVSSAI